MHFFLFIAFCTFSFHHHVLPYSFLHFLFPQSSLQAQKTPSLNEPHKSFASEFIHFFTLSLNCSLVFVSFNFHTLHCMFCFIFMRLKVFLTSTTTNLCCSFQGITLTSFKIFLLFFFPPKQNQSQFHYHLNCKSLSFSPF